MTHLGWVRDLPGDTCSCKAQLGKTITWKLLSWKVRNEMGKNEVRKILFKLSNFAFYPTALSNYIYPPTRLWTCKKSKRTQMENFTNSLTKKLSRALREAAVAEAPLLKNFSSRVQGKIFPFSDLAV